MDDDARRAGFLRAAEPLSQFLKHLEAAQQSHAALIHVVGQFEGVTVDELAVGLGVSHDFSESLVRGDAFEDSLVPQPRMPVSSEEPDWRIVWTD